MRVSTKSGFPPHFTKCFDNNPWGLPENSECVSTIGAVAREHLRDKVRTDRGSASKYYFVLAGEEFVLSFEAF
jgi:hypothetical protein